MHNYYKSKPQGNWLQKLMAKMIKPFSAVGTIGPIIYKPCTDGPNRKMRRKSKMIWRRYGEKAKKLMELHDIKIDEALTMAMACKR